MSIPEAKSAIIPPEKLVGYLLEPSHPVGGPKADWFLLMGYRPENPQRLEQDLLKVATDTTEYVTKTTAFGIKYIVSSSKNVVDRWF